MDLIAELTRIAEGRGSQPSAFSLSQVAQEALREIAYLRSQVLPAPPIINVTRASGR